MDKMDKDAEIARLKRLLNEAYDENEKVSRELICLRAMFLHNVPPEALTYTKRQYVA